jgi:hypothetical protein
MKFEISKVANGFIVTPSRDQGPGLDTPLIETNVFQKFGQMSAWLEAQFEGAPADVLELAQQMSRQDAPKYFGKPPIGASDMLDAARKLSR